MGIEKTYYMSGSGFRSSTSYPTSHRSGCRYRYYSKYEVDRGEIECLYADKFSWLYLPITCLNNLKKKIRKVN